MQMSNEDQVQVIAGDDWDLWVSEGGFVGEPYTAKVEAAEVEQDGVVLQVKVICRYMPGRNTFAAQAVAQTTDPSRIEPAAVRNLRVRLQVGNSHLPSKVNPLGGMVVTGIVTITTTKHKAPPATKALASCEIPDLQVETKTVQTPATL